MTLNITTIRVMTVSITIKNVTPIIMPFSLAKIKRDIQHNDTQHNGRASLR